MSTENLVSNENLLALTSVLEQATLPLEEGSRETSGLDAGLKMASQRNIAG